MSTTTLAQKRIFVFDSPRTCSNLFLKLFSQHPQLDLIYEPYIAPSAYGPEGVNRILHCKPESRAAIDSLLALNPANERVTYDDATKEFERKIREVEPKGKIPWIKDHVCYLAKPAVVLATLRSNASVQDVLKAHENPIVIPPSLLSTLTPVFLIRHPAHVVRSFWVANMESLRADVDDEQFKFMVTLRWARILFEHLQRQGRREVVVIDAEDLVQRTQAVTDVLCEKVGIDARGVVLQWEAQERDANEDLGHFFRSRLNGSRGIERNEGNVADSELDFQQLETTWVEKYGEHVGKTLRRIAEEEMEDYQYLRGFKVL